MQSWVLGYGFKHIYMRRACLDHPFPDEHFGEDYKFMLGLKDAGLYVATFRDREGVVLHTQHGSNLSNSHASRVMSIAELEATPLAETPGFKKLTAECFHQSGPS